MNQVYQRRMWIFSCVQLEMEDFLATESRFLIPKKKYYIFMRLKGKQFLATISFFKFVINPKNFS